MHCREKRSTRLCRLWSKLHVALWRFKPLYLLSRGPAKLLVAMRAVQTAFSCTKPVSIACWKCGNIGHFQKLCRSKGPRRCFACHEAGHILRFCPTRLQKSADYGQLSPGKKSSCCFEGGGVRRRMGGILQMPKSPSHQILKTLRQK